MTVILLCQLIVVALLGAELVVLALWDQKREPASDPFKPWREAPEGTHKPMQTELGKLL